MKFLFKNLLIFLSIYIVLSYTLFLFDQGHTTNYNIGNFNIKETFKSKDNNYYFDIKSDKLKINFQINQNYRKNEKVLKKIKYKKIDSYECILPIFKNNKIITDVMCLKDGIIYYAHDLNNENINNEFKKYGYDKNIYIDKGTKVEVSNNQSLYKENLLENNYLAIETYKGLTLFNGKESTIKIFENDVYKKPISIFTGKYYIVADYSSQYTFKNFYVVNIINGEKINIRSYDEISFDSYIMGSVDKDIYLFDKDAQKEYKISIEYENVEEVGNKNNIKYYNGEWTTITLNEALNEKKFSSHPNVDGYEKVDKINNYYYYYKKEDNKYQVFQADVQNKKLKTYLFETTDLNSIIYLKNAIYFRNGKDFCYYSNNGVRKVLTDTELEFNNDISLGVYEK